MPTLAHTAAGSPRLLEALGAGEGLTRYVGGAVRDELLRHPGQRPRPRHPTSPRRGRRAARESAHQGGSHRHRAWHGHRRRRRAAASRSPPCAPTSRPTAAAPRSPSPTTGAPTPRGAISPSTRSTPIRSPARSSIISAVSTTSPRAASASSANRCERIAEDHLRILRFFRFHARFGEGEIGPRGARGLHRARQRPDGPVARADRRRDYSRRWPFPTPSPPWH